MKLYTFFRSSASFRLRIALNLKGLDHEPVFVSLPKMENFDPEFTALNPQQLLPALVDGDDVLGTLPRWRYRISDMPTKIGTHAVKAEKKSRK